MDGQDLLPKLTNSKLKIISIYPRRRGLESKQWRMYVLLKTTIGGRIVSCFPLICARQKRYSLRLLFIHDPQVMKDSNFNSNFEQLTYAHVA